MNVKIPNETQIHIRSLFTMHRTCRYEDNIKITVDPENGDRVLGTTWFAPNTPLLSKLLWLPLFIWEQFKMLVITFKALNCTRPGYCPDCCFLKISTCSTRSDRMNGLHRPSLRCYHLAEPRKHGVWWAAQACDLYYRKLWKLSK